MQGNGDARPSGDRPERTDARAEYFVMSCPSRPGVQTPKIGLMGGSDKEPGRSSSEADARGTKDAIDTSGEHGKICTGHGVAAM